MPRTCTICTHPEGAAIDQALVRGQALTAIAALYRVSDDALQRHKRDHLPALLAKAQDAAEVVRADNLLGQARELHGKALGLLDKAENAGDYKTALQGIGQARGCLELLAKLLGELDERPQVNILIQDEWQAIRATLVQALAPYPEARQTVAAALLRIEAGHAGA